MEGVGGARRGSGIRLTRPDYYIIPDLKRLETAVAVDEEGRCWVEGLRVGRRGYGSVHWPGRMDVGGLDLDCLVHFHHKSVHFLTVYPNDQDKPDRGCGLNGSAEVTLERVWPDDDSTHVKGLNGRKEQKFRERLERACERMESEFVDYQPRTGTWVFKVQRTQVSHFTKYGLEDTESEEEEKGPKRSGRHVLGKEVMLLPLGHLQRQKLHHNSPPPKRVEGMDGGPSWALGEGEGERGGSEMREEAPKISDMDQAVQEDFTRISQESAPPGFYEDSMVSEEGEHELYEGSQPQPDRNNPTFSVIKENIRKFREEQEEEDSYSTDESIRQIKRDRKNRYEAKERAERMKKDEEEAERVREARRAMEQPRPLLPFDESLTAYKHTSDYGADASLFHNRSFRVSWGPGNIEGIMTQKRREKALGGIAWILPQSPKSLALQTGYGLRLERLVPEKSTEAVVKRMKKMLDFQIPLSEWIQEGPMDVIPLIKPLTLKHIHSKYEEQTRDSEVEHGLCQLSAALWKSREVLCPGEERAGDFVVEMTRKRMLGKWITETCRKAVQERIAELKEKKMVTWRRDAGLLLVSNGEVKEGASLVMKDGDSRMSLLMAQAGASDETRSLCLEQLSQWLQTGEDLQIKEDRMRYTMLLAGKMVWKRSDGKVLHIYHGLHWKQAFGLHLWYGCKRHASIAEVLAEYERSWEGEDGLAPAPLPDYRTPKKEDRSPMIHAWEEREEERLKNIKKPPYDVSYHLLKLFCDETYPLDHLLDPQANTPDIFDFHMRCTERRSSVHAGYAAQLADIPELWTYAPFALMHIPDPGTRSASVKKFLVDRAADLSDEVAEFLVTEIRVPAEWIAGAKAIWFRHKKKVIPEITYAAKAGAWTFAHMRFVNYLAPRAVVNKKWRVLGNVVEILGDKADVIEGWDKGGQVFRDFLLLRGSMEAVKTGEDTQESLRDLIPAATALVPRLMAMDCPTPMELQSQGDISKKLCQFFRSVLTKKELRDMGPRITELPMPDDYMMEEIHYLTQLALDLADEECSDQAGSSSLSPPQ